MNDNLYPGSQDDELDAILREVHGGQDENSDDTQPSKQWSMDDIDRLIAAENGEEYVPAEPVGETQEQESEYSAESELDEELFTVKPIDEKDEADSGFEDISSNSNDIYSGSHEVDGQEKFFEDDEPEEDTFDASMFKLETYVMPDAVPETEIKYNNKTEKPEPLPPSITKPEPKKEEPIDYRKRFFEKLKPEDIEIPGYDDSDPEYPFDKSGIVVRKTEQNREGDLEPMPTVMAAEDARHIDEAKTKIVPFPTPKPVDDDEVESKVDGQIVLTDFVDMPQDEIPEQSREDDIESNLLTKRRQKAKNFKVEEIGEEFSPDFDTLKEDLPLEEDDDDGEKTEEPAGASLVEIIGEYNEPTDRNKIHTKLTERVKRTTQSAILMGIVEFALLIFAIIPALTDELPFFADGNVLPCILNALLIIVAVVIDSGRFFDTFTETIKGNITANSATVIAVALALIENTVSAVTDGSMPVFGVVAVFGLLLNKLTDAVDARRILNNFSVCAFNYEHNMYAVHPFDNESEVFELGRGLLMGNAEMLYSSSIAFPSDFIKNSDTDKDNDKYVKYMILGSLVASLIGGIIVGIKQKDFKVFFAAFTAAVCLSAPIFGRFIPALITFVTNKRLNREGTMIANLDTAEKISAANAVVLDSADIFDRNACTMHGMKDFKSMRIDVVLLYAAAMVIKSGGPLKECFEAVIDGRQDLLPPVRELVYEDKLGISARIYEQKVLLGNRNMLIHHSIKVPEKSFEEKYIHSGRKVIYLACNEQLAAMFVVSYSVDDDIKNYLKQLESNGIQILVRTNDVNVTENLISNRFGLSPDNFKILSSVAGRLYKRRKDAVIDRLPAGIIHDGEPQSMLKSIAACCTMALKNKIGMIVSIAVMVIGVLFTVLAGIGEGGMTAAFAVLIMLIETVCVTGVLFIGKK